MDVVLVIVIAVGAPLLVKVAVPSGWVPPDQLPGVVHEATGPIQVASTACAVPAADKVTNPKLPRSAKRFRVRPSHAADGHDPLNCMLYPDHTHGPPRSPASGQGHRPMEKALEQWQ